jgi:hypothetical protein
MKMIEIAGFILFGRLIQRSLSVNFVVGGLIRSLALERKLKFKFTALFVDS